MKEVGDDRSFPHNPDITKQNKPNNYSTGNPVCLMNNIFFYLSDCVFPFPSRSWGRRSDSRNDTQNQRDEHLNKDIIE